MTFEQQDYYVQTIKRLSDALRAAASDLEPLASPDLYIRAGSRGPELVEMIIREIREALLDDL